MIKDKLCIICEITKGLVSQGLLDPHEYRNIKTIDRLLKDKDRRDIEANKYYKELIKKYKGKML